MKVERVTIDMDHMTIDNPNIRKYAGNDTITKNELSFLMTLLKNAPSVVSIAQIHNARYVGRLWDILSLQEKESYTNSLRIAVSRFRRKIDPFRHDVIATVPEYGYILVLGTVDIIRDGELVIDKRNSIEDEIKDLKERMADQNKAIAALEQKLHSLQVIFDHIILSKQVFIPTTIAKEIRHNGL